MKVSTYYSKFAACISVANKRCSEHYNKEFSKKCQGMSHSKQDRAQGPKRLGRRQVAAMRNCHLIYRTQKDERQIRHRRNLN
ncbi:uncharacterized protein LOC128250805 isoform X6 [Octopus bimaculoides]|uniref:uncharacterized protein LOC128250805 isoform X6 n=1 Tax=Octopus bimaculoides TaxID=37653 RepID=UPI0022E8494D|nr:uncharacterized protein LOC128250805 isoform X6 [Octopus bimaculoides]